MFFGNIHELPTKGYCTNLDYQNQTTQFLKAKIALARLAESEWKKSDLVAFFSSPSEPYVFEFGS